MSGAVQTKTPDHMTTYKSNLSLAAKMLSEHNIIGVIEPINKYSVPNYFLNDYQKGKTIYFSNLNSVLLFLKLCAFYAYVFVSATSVIQEIDSPYIKLQLDLFHLQHICGNLTKNIQNLLPIVGTSTAF